MRIFHAFLVLVAATILFMLPVTQSVYAFRTDVKSDTFNVVTTVATTNATVVLLRPVYLDDINTVSITSNVSESPIAYSYASGTKSLVITDLTAGNITHSLVVSYDTAAFTATSAISNLLDRTPWLWMLMIIAFAPAALAAIFMGRA